MFRDTLTFIRDFCAAVGLLLVIGAIYWACGATNEDDYATKATAESVTALGKEARTELSPAELKALQAKVRLSMPFQPYRQLQYQDQQDAKK